MKFSLKQVGLVACTAVLSLSLFGCGAQSSESSGDSGKQDTLSVELKAVDYTKADYNDVKDGGELRLTLGELPPQGNVWHMDAGKYSRSIWVWYNPELILMDEKFEPRPNPEYLTNVKAEEKDGKTVVTYDINEKANFNDGTPIDWKAFETTWKINNGKSDAYAPNSTDGYQDIESVTKGANDRQVVVTFDKIFPWYWSLFGSLAHPKLEDPEFYANGYLEKPQNDLGAGPYMVESYDQKAGKVTFVKNPKWWGRPGKLDRITFTAMGDQASINAMKNNEIDAVGIGTAERYAALKDIPDTKVYMAGSAANEVFMLNAHSDKLKDIKVREAIMRAIDRKQLAEINFNGLDYKPELSGSFLYFPYQKEYHDNFAEAVTFDPEAAKKLLDEAGWKPGDDGIRVKDGARLELNFPTFSDDKTIKAVLLAEQQMLKTVGVDMKIVERPPADFSQVYTKREFDAMSLMFYAGDPYGVAYFGQMYGSDSGLNLSGTGTPEMDAKIKELQALPTADAQVKRGNELEVEAFKLYGIMPGPVYPAMQMVKKDLVNAGATGFMVIPREEIGWKK